MNAMKMMLLGIPLSMAGACDPMPTEPQDAPGALASEDKPAATIVVRPRDLEDRVDIRRRAELEIDRRIVARPQDAAHRDALVRWREDQLRIDDMNESAPPPRVVGFELEVAR